MMSVIHAMVEKIYQAMTMLRDAEVHDRQQWLAYAQRQREEAEQDMSGRAAKVFSSAMAEVRSKFSYYAVCFRVRSMFPGF